MLNTGQIIEFDKIKEFRYVRQLGKGGTGHTHLFNESITDMDFAIKKYEPTPLNDIKENFERFIDEIKILFKISHPNVVRIYNYFLYPELETGYLQMEYVEGVPIDEYFFSGNLDDLERIFIESLSAFEYLESIDILHRDIRSNNILIDKFGEVKIIDFGFGKILNKEQLAGESVFLNWPVSEMPEDIRDHKIYDHQTEIFFLGSLFKNILNDNDTDFKYQNIINTMTELSRNNRYNNFSEIISTVSNMNFISGEFSKNDKETYINFADTLVNIINYFSNEFKPEKDIKIITENIEQLLRNNALENNIQSTSDLIRIFVNNSFNYSKRTIVEKEIVEDFYIMLINTTYYRQKIILDNIITRLSTINVKNIEDDLPF